MNFGRKSNSQSFVILYRQPCQNNNTIFILGFFITIAFFGKNIKENNESLTCENILAETNINTQASDHERHKSTKSARKISMRDFQN